MSSILKTTNIKHESSSSNNLVLGSDGSATIANGTLSAGTIGSGVTITDGANPHGWEHIKTIAFTADTSTDWASNSGANKMDNVISNKYSAYKLIIQWSGATANTDVYFRFIDSSGSVIDGANYNYGYQHVVSSTGEGQDFNAASSSFAQVANDVLSGALGFNAEMMFWNLYSGQSNFPQVDGHQLTHNARSYTYHPQCWFKQTGYNNPDYYQGGTGFISYNQNVYVRGFLLYYNGYNNVEEDSWWSCYGLKLPTAD